MSIGSRSSPLIYRVTSSSHSLLAVVEQERPGTEVGLIQVAGLDVLCITHEADEIWVALDSPPESDAAEVLLRQLAEMLLFCAACGERPRCHNQRRHVASKLRRFLGETGFRRFFAAALEIQQQSVFRTAHVGVTAEADTGR